MRQGSLSIGGYEQGCLSSTTGVNPSIFLRGVGVLALSKYKSCFAYSKGSK